MRHSIVSLLLTGCAFAATLAIAADHPVAGDKLVLKDPVSGAERRTFRFKATRDFGIDPSVGGDPTAAGATLEIVGRGAGDGTSGVVVLDQAHWVGLGEPPGAKGYKWLDTAFPNGVRKIFFKPGSKGGMLTAVGKGINWPYALGQAQVGPVDVRFAIGSDVWCARFAATTFQQSIVGKVRAALATAPADCAAPPSGLCGDGAVGGGEECDDGGTLGGDGCSATCELENTSAVCAGMPSVAGTGLDAVAVATGLARPTYATAPPLDPSRVFVLEQTGRIRLVKNGTLLPAAFLNLSSLTSAACPYDERGLLGMAFDPDYETNGLFYVNYTNLAGDTVIARYAVTGDPKTSDDGDETTAAILRTIPQDFANHNGGQLAFGPDGLLYVGMGDGGAGCDPFGRAQDDAQLLGKMLRIDVDAAPPGDPLDEIFAKGLRNPYRFSFDRANGNLYLPDVGQNKIEEVNVVTAPVPSGLNYGWEFFEGAACVDAGDCPGTTCPAPAGFTMPILTYTHADGCSIAGGYVYRGCAMPDVQGTYFYSDFCSAFVRTFELSGGVATNQQDRTADVDPAGADTLTSVTSFGEDARGEIYLTEQGACASATGTLYKLVPQP